MGAEKREGIRFVKAVPAYDLALKAAEETDRIRHERGLDKGPSLAEFYNYIGRYDLAEKLTQDKSSDSKI